MTLPASGPISLGQIADEFGVARTAPFPSAFYGLGGAPSSGPVSFADFYGRSVPAPPPPPPPPPTPPSATFTPDGGTVEDDASSPGTATVYLTCSQPAVWTFTLPGGASSNISSAQSSTFASFQTSLRGTRTFNVTGVSGSTSRNFTVILSVGQ